MLVQGSDVVLCRATRGRCHKEKPVYQAIYTRNTDFDEVLISPTMLTDHLATNILKAMEKVTFCHSNCRKKKLVVNCENTICVGPSRDTWWVMSTVCHVTFSSVCLLHTPTMFNVLLFHCVYYKTVFLCLFVGSHLHQFCMYSADVLGVI